MASLYQKNLSAIKLQDEALYKKLKAVESNERYDVTQGDIFDDINIYDTQEECFLYYNPLESVELQKKEFEKFREYDFLYLFGIGNGVLVKELLQNPKHQRIVIFEPNIELLYIAINLFDYSKDILGRRLKLMLTQDIDFATVNILFLDRNSALFIKVFQLLPTASYYEKVYQEELLSFSSLISQSLEFVISVVGNSVIDQFVGLKQHLQHISKMIQGPKFSDLTKSKNSDTAIIVSTGPSLSKQLPLLKEIRDYVTIISVDASLPVLEKADIKPDIVVSMERDEVSDVFHKKTSQKFQEEVIFLCASLQHNNVFKAIRAGTTALVMRPFVHNAYLGLDEYGYVCAGMSSANMAYELAVQMKFDQVVFIGQDLAYGPDGSSHTKGHVLGEDFIKDGEANIDLLQEEVAEDAEAPILDKEVYDQIELPAYSGKGMVKSIRPWQLFRDGLVQSVESSPFITSINATEGGARIEGTIEMPFKDAIEKYVDKSASKKQIKLQNTDKKEYQKLKRKTDLRIKKILEEGEQLLEKIKETFLEIMPACERLENKSLEEARNEFSVEETMSYLDTINRVRDLISGSKVFENFYYDILQSTIVHQELEMMKIKVWAVQNPEENQDKAVQWILAHRYWLFSLAGGLDHTINLIRESYSFDV